MKMKDERRASASVPLSLFLFLFHFPFPLSISNYRYHTTITPACTSLAACTSLTYIRQVYLPANFSFTRPPNGTRVLKIHAAHTFSRGRFGRLGTHAALCATAVANLGCAPAVLSCCLHSCALQATPLPPKQVRCNFSARNKRRVASLTPAAHPHCSLRDSVLPASEHDDTEQSCCFASPMLQTPQLPPKQTRRHFWAHHVPVQHRSSGNSASAAPAPTLLSATQRLLASKHDAATKSCC